MKTAVQKRSVPRRTHLSHTEKIRCAFCKGTGKDPFGQLYPGSTCQVCHGRGEVFIQPPYKNCAYCHGSGIEFTMQNTCTACNGHGVISISKSQKNRLHPCPSCRGTGMNSETNLPCAHCRGIGEACYGG